MHHTISFLAALSLMLLGMLAGGCAQPEPFTTVSLAGQLAPDEPPGPWRPVGLPGIDPAWFARAEGLAVMRDGELRPASELAAEEPDVIRTLIRDGALIQTERLSTLSLPQELEAGQRIVYRLRYPGIPRGHTGPWPLEAVAVRALGEGDEGVAVGILRDYRETGRWRMSGPYSKVVQGGSLVGAGGPGRVEIVHRMQPGTPLKLRSIDMLAVDAGADQLQLERAAHFLESGGSDGSLFFAGAAYRRLVRVSRSGMTAHCAVLTPGDRLVFDLPADGAGNRMAFHALRPPKEKDLDAWLELEREVGGAWVRVRYWPREDMPPGQWAPLDADLAGTPVEAGRIRLTHAGKDGVIGIADPVLLPASGRAPDRPNLVLVSLDTLRADRLGCYGYTGHPASARLDHTMDEWGFTVFRQAFSASPWTIPGTAKFMASRYLDFHVARRIPEKTTMLAEVLRDQGYYCAAFTGGGMVAVTGMEQGFHEYHWSSGFGKVEGSFPQAGRWLGQWDGGPFFLFVHTYETHRPYTRDTYCRDIPRGRLGDLSAGERLQNSEATTVADLTDEERAYVQAAYDSGVHHACEATADLLDLLEQTGNRRRTVVVILSDHGEELWDRHEIFGAHGHSLHQEMLDVPLLVHSPETAGQGLRNVETPVSTVDVPPTVADLLGVSWPGGADGVSLVPLLGGGRLERGVPILADLQRSRIHPQVLPQVCLIENGIKYIDPLAPGTTPEPGPLTGIVPPVAPGLFRLALDPGERRNLAAADPELAARMKERLHQALGLALQPEDLEQGRQPEEPRLSDELEEQLQALGYVD